MDYVPVVLMVQSEAGRRDLELSFSGHFVRGVDYDVVSDELALANKLSDRKLRLVVLTTIDRQRRLSDELALKIKLASPHLKIAIFAMLPERGTTEAYSFLVTRHAGRRISKELVPVLQRFIAELEEDARATAAGV